MRVGGQARCAPARVELRMRLARAHMAGGELPRTCQHDDQQREPSSMAGPVAAHCPQAALSRSGDQSDGQRRVFMSLKRGKTALKAIAGVSPGARADSAASANPVGFRVRHRCVGSPSHKYCLWLPVIRGARDTAVERPDRPRGVEESASVTARPSCRPVDREGPSMAAG